MLNIGASVRVTSLISLLSGVLIVGALGAVQTGNGNVLSKNIAYRPKMRRGKISDADSSTMGENRRKHMFLASCVVP